MDALDLEWFPPLEEWDEVDWQEAIRMTRYSRARAAYQPGDPDPRLHLVDLDALDLDQFLPLEEWSEDDWDEAILITKSVEAELEPNQHPPVPLEVLIDRLGFDVVDGEVRRRE